MTEAEYSMWAPRSRREYAADKMKANSLSQQEADKIAEDSFKTLLPEGLKSKDNFLYSVKNENQENIGFIWFMIRGNADNRRAFVCDIVIEEPYHGQGFCKKTMQLL